MILTGKAKEDFYTFLIENHPLSKNDVEKWFLSLYNEFKNTLIIEWFDSVGIYIEIFIYTDTIANFKSYINKEIVVDNYGFVYFESRKEAIEQAIKKANKIYNEM